MQHTLISDRLNVSINISGAELSSVKNKDGLEFMWQAKKEVWPRHAPVLFPIVGKLKDNSYLFDAIRYELGQHGFARDRDFELIEITKNSCTFQLCSDAKSKENFPFDFIFRITYELVQNTLTTHYKITNPSSSTELYFSVGAHPAFNCPLQKNESFEDYYLEFESSSLQITELNNGLRKTLSGNGKKDLPLNSRKLHLTKETFDKDALVFENKQISKISLRSNKSSHTISMQCENWPYFGTWSKKGCTEFVCLEPWYGIADHENASQKLTEKDGIIKLDAEKSFVCSFSVTFE